jgi:hypothetical protein
MPSCWARAAGQPLVSHGLDDVGITSIPQFFQFDQIVDFETKRQDDRPTSTVNKRGYSQS